MTKWTADDDDIVDCRLQHLCHHNQIVQRLQHLHCHIINILKSASSSLSSSQDMKAGQMPENAEIFMWIDPLNLLHLIASKVPLAITQFDELILLGTPETSFRGLRTLKVLDKKKCYLNHFPGLENKSKIYGYKLITSAWIGPALMFSHPQSLASASAETCLVEKISILDQASSSAIILFYWHLWYKAMPHN